MKKQPAPYLHEDFLTEGYIKRLRAKQRITLEQTAHAAAFAMGVEAKLRDATGMLSTPLVVAWYRKRFPKKARELEAGIAERSMKTKVKFHRERMH